jgi:hypothetical protein
MGPREAFTPLEGPGLPRDWVRVLERHPEGVVGLPEYVWVHVGESAVWRSMGEHDYSDYVGGTATIART